MQEVCSSLDPQIGPHIKSESPLINVPQPPQQISKMPPNFDKRMEPSYWIGSESGFINSQPSMAEFLTHLSLESPKLNNQVCPVLPDGIDGVPEYPWMKEKKTARKNNSQAADGTLLHPEEPDNGVVAIITIAVSIVVILVLGSIILCYYRHFMHRNLTSMNFDNPVYRKTTEDQFSLEKNLPARMYPSIVDEETQEPLNKPGTNEFVQKLRKKARGRDGDRGRKVISDIMYNRHVK